jgi:hypothetical protein
MSEMKHEGGSDGGGRRRHGSPSRISRQQVIAAARRHFVDGVMQATLAAELGISPSYMARLIERARRDGYIRLVVEDEPCQQALESQAMLRASSSQLLLTVDGEVVTLVANTAHITPIEQTIMVGNVLVTIKIERGSDRR